MVTSRDVIGLSADFVHGRGLVAPHADTGQSDESGQSQSWTCRSAGLRNLVLYARRLPYARLWATKPSSDTHLDMGATMIRRSILTGAALLISLIVLPATTSSAQARPNVIGTGITHCNGGWNRGLEFAPALTNVGPFGATDTVTLTTTMPACAGGVPVPASGVVLGKGVINMAGATNCASYFTAAATDVMNFGPGAAFTGKITWTPAAIVPSNFSLATITATSGVPAAPVIFKGLPIAVSGSYPTPTAGKFKFHTVKSLATILSAAGTDNCGSPLGLRKLGIAAAGSKGKF
jgi:hypothetical protein